MISIKYGAHTQIMLPMMVTWQSVNILQIHNGGGPPYWKLFFGYTSTIYCPINAIFGRNKHNHVTKIPIFENQDGGRPPFWKWFYHCISSKNHPISMKFGVLTQIVLPRTVTWHSLARSPF